MQNERSRAECLVVLGGIAATRESFEDAARLFGAADRLRGDAPPNRFEVPVLERFEPELDARLGEGRAAELRSEGTPLGSDALISPVASGADRH